MKKGMVFISAFVLTVAAQVAGQNYVPLPDTGQTACYDVANNVIICPAEGQPLHGQDAQYHKPDPAHQDNGDGTVTDLNTGLMWMRNTADTNNDGVIDTTDQLTWQAAVDYCAGLTNGGHGDWRLPSYTALESIVDYGRFAPAINPVFSSQLGRYWSATTRAVDTSYVWHVYFHSGQCGYSAKSSDHYVRCIRR